jgi:hypothetical protein
LASDEIVHVALAREVHGHLEHRLEDDNINEQQLSRTQIAVLGEAANLEELAYTRHGRMKIRQVGSFGGGVLGLRCGPGLASRRSVARNVYPSALFPVQLAA